MASLASSGTVVVGIDYSPDSLHAAEYAAWEARHRQVPLTVIHAVMPAGAIGAGFGTSTVVELLHKDGGQLLTETIDHLRARHSGLEINPALVSSGAAGVLITESEHAALVVVGARGSGGFPKLLLGSVAGQVASHAHAPVVVVRGEPNGPVPAPGPVVVGVDGSDLSEVALGFAFDAATARGSELVAIYAWDAWRWGGNAGPAGRNIELDTAQAEADRLLAAATAGWIEKYPDVRVTLRAEQADNPESKLLEAATNASLLVVGSRGRGGFVGLLLGSVSRKLVAHATSSVAVAHNR